MSIALWLTTLLAVAPAAGHQDLVYFAEDRPVLFRFQVVTDGKALPAALEELVEALMKYADRNGDGVLDKAEQEQLPSPETLFGGGPLAPGRTILGNRPTTKAKLTRDDLRAQYGRGGAFQVQQSSGAQAASQGVTQRLLKLLDTDDDGKLSRSELKAAEATLDKLDLDGDELLSLQEVGNNPYVAQDSMRGLVVRTNTAQPGRPIDPGAPFLTPGEGRDNRLAFRLAEKYGPSRNPAKDPYLLREHLSLDEAAFAKLDANKDGKLDHQELGRFNDRAPDLELTFRLGKKADGEKAVSAAGPLAVTAQVGTESVIVTLGNTRLTLGLAGPEGPAFVTSVRSRDITLMQFKAADTDNNGYLDKKEADANPLFRASFKQMDRDGDGMVFEKEAVAYLEAIEGLQKLAAAARATLSVGEGQGLFELLGGKEGRLTRRNLRNAVKLLDTLDHDKDNALALAELPRQFQFNVGRGQAGGFGPQVFAVQITGGMGAASPPPAKPGPRWFHKMDRNGDGDVSANEFLGPPEAFQKMDRDGDGLISQEEATDADKAGREKASR